jgi:hypothetical protein
VQGVIGSNPVVPIKRIKNMKKLFFCFIYILLFFAKNIFAVCPMCTFAVGAGIGLAQYFGIDDTITGIWIGGLIVSLIAWTIYWFDQKNICFYGRKILITIFYYFITIAPLYTYNIMGHVLNKFLGIDKILLGIIIGSVVFFSSILFSNYLKIKNSNRAYFPFQKVIIPVLSLCFLSIFFCFLTF